MKLLFLYYDRRVEYIHVDLPMPHEMMVGDTLFKLERSLDGFPQYREVRTNER